MGLVVRDSVKEKYWTESPSVETSIGWKWCDVNTSKTTQNNIHLMTDATKSTAKHRYIFSYI